MVFFFFMKHEFSGKTSAETRAAPPAKLMEPLVLQYHQSRVWAGPGARTPAQRKRQSALQCCFGRPWQPGLQVTALPARPDLLVPATTCAGAGVRGGGLLHPLPPCVAVCVPMEGFPAWVIPYPRCKGLQVGPTSQCVGSSQPCFSAWLSCW